WPPADESGGADGVGALMLTLQTVAAVVGRTEARIALLHERRLPVHVPMARAGCRRIAVLARGRLRIGYAEPAIEPHPQHVLLDRRLEARAGRECDADRAEALIDVLQSRRPLRRDADLGA